MSNRKDAARKDKERRRIVYDFATGRLFLAESDVEISPLIPSSGLSKQASPNGYTIENNVLSLCEASSNGPGIVYALQTNKNLGFGKGSLFSVLEGKENSSFGHGAGKRLAEGDKNSLFGFSAADELVEGELNVAVGASSLCTLKKGDANVCIGVFSGDGMIAGSRNVFLGFHSRAKKQDISCSVVIGYNAVGEKSNELLVSDQIHSFRMRGLEMEPRSCNATMLCHDQTTGLLSPIKYPLRMKNASYVEHDTIKKLLQTPVCFDSSGSTFIELDKAKDIPGVTTKDASGQVSGINHPNLIMTILAAAQELREDISTLKKKAKEVVPVCPTEKRLCDLEAKLGEDIDIKRELSVLTEKMGNLPTENSESIERLHQKMVKLEKKLLELVAQTSLEKEAYSKLSEKVETLSAFGTSQNTKTQSSILLLSEENRELFERLCSAEEQNLKLSCALKEQKEETDKKLQEQKEETLSVMKRQHEELMALLKHQQKENRPISPLQVSTSGDLRKRIIPIDKILDDWENIS
ncbi:HA-like repeat protein [Tokyovirus A1]|uniref:HA-like repeat protein n=1 Tax=Tokyovirus A1 TaxID=1826170 RepID=UPI0007A9723E|nr:HA-like repeat protein [Tokyovirus A1]BAU80024.1 HA-like repeat protein [Tokyovirus A1]